MHRPLLNNRIGSSSGPEPNTFIGGVGASYITSAADYASYSVDLTESDVQNFQIDGSNNVSFYIDFSYTLTTAILSNISAWTYFIDADGLITSIASNSMRLSANCTHVYIPNVQSPAQGLIYSMAGLKHVNVESDLVIDGRFKYDTLANIKKFYFPNATSIIETNISYSNFKGLTSLERLYIPEVDTFTTISMEAAMIGYLGRNMNSGCKIYYNSALGTTDRNAFNTITFANNSVDIGDIFYVDGRSYEAVAASPVEGEFLHSSLGAQLANNFHASLDSDTRSGATDFTYVLLTDVVLVYSDTVGVSGEVSTTEDAGNTGSAAWLEPTLIGGNDLHPFLVYSRDYRSATVVECSTPITVNTPTSLSASNQTATSVDLNFTTPTSNANGTDAYEVWVDDGTVYRKWFEYDEISASGDTLDLTEVYNDVGTISGVKIKIRTIDGQMNFSSFSNEITLP